MVENTPYYKREALILAGGLGTRLKSTVPDKPKCLAPVAGQPFLDFVVDHAIKNGVEHIVFCLGYMASLIESHVQERYSGHVAITIVLEEEALGTGGAIKNGAKYIKGDRFFALNGDSLFAIAYDDLEMSNNEQDIIATIGLKPMVNFERYGTVILDDKGMIQSFFGKTSHGIGPHQWRNIPDQQGEVFESRIACKIFDRERRVGSLFFAKSNWGSYF